jgi:tRNA (guanine26-N2/guanine27-N2)-dimethyltransferase
LKGIVPITYTTHNNNTTNSFNYTTPKKGKRPERALAAWGSYLRALPAPNEQGLRALIGAAVREGAACGLSVTPLFSLYSFHGPVFRAMLRVKRRGGAWRPDEFGFVGHCFSHAETRRISFDELGNAVCPVCERERTHGNARRPRLVVSGPMWTGPLHDADFVAAMTAEAAARGWDGHAGGGSSGGSGGSASTRTKNAHRGLKELLEVMAEEASARLPPWHVHLDGVARRLTAAPGRAPLIEALRAAGFEAARCHVERKAVRTNARMEQIVAAAAAAGLAQPRPGLADEEEEGVKQM